MTVLAQTQHLLEEGIRVGLHIGAQLYVARNRETLADLALGDAAPGVPMQTDTLTLWLSACKPVTAVAIAQQYEQGKLDLDARVARYIPNFAHDGKHTITVRHLLTHTAGFRTTRFEYPRDDWDTIIRKICDTPIERKWTPGEKAGYHIDTSWFILGELVQRLTDTPLSQYLRRHIFEPLGMRDSWIGMPPEQYDAYGDRLAQMPDTSKNPPEPLGWHEREWVTHTRPSGNGYGPMRELARFYEMLLSHGELDNARILQPETVDLFTARHRGNMFDHTFQHTVDWGLGFIINSNRHGPETIPYGYGRHASENTFGHSGSQSSAAFADPAHDLAVALLFNGTPGEKAHQQRVRATLTALYEDLDLI
ncbi:MAG: serine hydrolase domain-containing protein [Phycisphaeraceae bacterium]